MTARFLILIAAASLVVSSGPAGPFDEVLRRVDLDEQTARFDLETMYKFGPGSFRLAFFDSFFGPPAVFLKY